MRTSGFIGKTLVHTPAGLVPIQQIRTGDRVLSGAGTGLDRIEAVVVGVQSSEEIDVCCIDFWQSIEGWENGERGGLVLTNYQQLWEQGEAWKHVGQHTGANLLECLDGSTVEWINRSPLFRTDVEGVVWMHGMVDSTRGGGLGRTIDLRGPTIRFSYEMVANGDCDTADSAWEFRSKVFQLALALEGDGGYFVGDWGVRVRGALAGGV